MIFIKVVRNYIPLKRAHFSNILRTHICVLQCLRVKREILLAKLNLTFFIMFTNATKTEIIRFIIVSMDQETLFTFIEIFKKLYPPCGGYRMTRGFEK